MAEGSAVSAAVKSTLHDFDAVPNRYRGFVDLPPAGAGKGAHIRLVFAAAEITTGNFLRDAVLRGQALRVEKYPEAVFESRTAQFLGAEGDALRYRISGRFSLHGVAREISVPVRVRRASGAVTVEGKFRMRLSDYKIVPPSLPFIRVEDVVEVKVHFLLRPKR